VETIKENDETFSFKIEHNNNLLNIFFDKLSYEIKGWTTTDVYLNRVETNLTDMKTNIMIDQKVFKIQNYIN
jgi:outer membrane lipoprotein-sorting protein